MVQVWLPALLNKQREQLDKKTGAYPFFLCYAIFMNKKIVFDCLGGDKGLAEMLPGAITALTKHPDLKMVLVGDAGVIGPQVAQFGDRVEVVDSKENIAMDEHPTEAIRHKPNSSLVLGLEQLKTRDDCGAFLSAGSTGAVLTGGFLKVGRIPGVSRPAMCPNLPTAVGNQTFMLIDCGANMDCAPVNLVHFAVMANEYQKLRGIANPRVALLNVGSESTKGNELVKATHALLTKLSEAGQINFVGNIEADQVFKATADIVVTDGFWGNVLLKSVEGTVKFAFGEVKKVLTSSFLTKIGALLVGGKLKEFAKAKMDGQAASIFIGLKKPVIKMHGNANAAKVVAAIEYAMSVVDLDLGDVIAKALTTAEPIIGKNE